MKIQVICDGCNQSATFDASEAGMVVPCPQCGNLVTLPIDATAVGAGPTDGSPIVATPIDGPAGQRADIGDPPTTGHAQEQEPSANPYATSHQADLAYAPYPGSRPLGDDAAVRMLLPVGRSGWAIAAGYAGLFAMTCFLAPVAIVLGYMALRDIKRSGGKKHGAGRAWFGLIMGIIFTVIPVGLFIVAIISDAMR